MALAEQIAEQTTEQITEQIADGGDAVLRPLDAQSLARRGEAPRSRR